MTLAHMHDLAEAIKVLRTLIVALGGFCTVAALILAAWYLLPLRHHTDEPMLATLMLGLLLVSYAGLAALTADHINQHLIENDAPAWQLWTALAAFATGAVTLLSLLAVRVDRRSRS